MKAAESRAPMPPSWRDPILREFSPGVAQLTLVADPDELLLEPDVLVKMRERGFELLPYEDPIAFRYAYEVGFRCRWERGEAANLVVLLCAPADNLRALPYDLLRSGRALCFSLGDLFPSLSYPVVSTLDRADLDALFRAQSEHPPGRLGDNGTKDFILHHVFDIAPEVIIQASDLLRVLLRRHYRALCIPQAIDQRLLQLLKQSHRFEAWPLDAIVPDRDAFFAFLQQRWPAFLQAAITQRGTLPLEEVGARYDPGQADGTANTLARSESQASGLLPFDHDDVKIYIDNLFLEGLLDPVRHEQASLLKGSWAAVGVHIDPIADRLRRLNRLIDNTRNEVPSAAARHSEWFHFAYRWAEIRVLQNEAGATLPPPTKDRIDRLGATIDEVFLDWMQRRYVTLHNQPPVPPAMLHHIPRMLARELDRSDEKKVAFVLVDGLALDQWIVLRDVLKDRKPELSLREHAVFAWVPTLTSVSRQAAFSGKSPVYFPSSIHTTAKEPRLWQAFWTDHGLPTSAITYIKSLGGGRLGDLDKALADPRLRVAGLVVDKVDKVMHGMTLGSAGMHNQVRQWAEAGFMSQLIDRLIEHGFRVFLSADHGNIEAVGCGSPAEGAVAELRGERVRVYRDERLRSAARQRSPDALPWPPLGLPEDYLALLAPPRKAFVHEGETLVSHGGISIEELIVPLIEVRTDRP